MLNNNQIQEMVSFAESIGLVLSDTMLLNASENKINRAGTIEHPRSKNGWYIIKHDDFSGYLCFQCGNYEQNDGTHKLHLSSNQNQKKKLSPKEVAELKLRISDVQKQQALQISKDKEKKANFYRNIFAKLKNSTYHVYMENKKIFHIKRYGFKEQVKYPEFLLCIPFYQGGVIQGYQTISENGSKRFKGHIKGCYWHYTPKPNYKEYKNVFILGEGVATVLSAFEALEAYYGDAICFHPLVSFGCNNLDAVVNATKDFGFDYVILADNDIDNKRNTGVESACQLIKNHPNKNIQPLILPDGDANDYILANGQQKFIEYFKQRVYLGDMK